MKDRELLEAAAKAAGIHVRLVSWAIGTRAFDGQAYKIEGTQTQWNPLTDDGDALRLAVALRLFHEDDFMFSLMDSTSKKKDPCAATRRAIVRAAASMASSEQ